jgi:membrane protein implicated in regulation of membrane protease activity
VTGVAGRSPERMATIMAIDYLILGVVALGVGVIGLARGDGDAALFVVVAAVVLVMSARWFRRRGSRG